MSQVDKLSSNEAELLQEHNEFVTEFAQFLCTELAPGVSYSRHILALQTLQLLFKISMIAESYVGRLGRLLLNLVLDPFDDVRTLSSSLLTIVLERRYENDLLCLVQEVSHSIAALAARTCRHDHADAAGRLLNIASHINRQVGPSTSTSQIGRTDQGLDTAIITQLCEHVKSSDHLLPGSNFPLHAMLLATKYQLDSSGDAAMKCNFHGWNIIVETCRRIWELVQAELCIDSPETATDETDHETSGGPKDVLAYCWRALRDSR